MRSTRGNRPALTSEPGASATMTETTDSTKASSDSSAAASATDSASDPAADTTSDGSTSGESSDEAKDDTGAAPPPPVIDATRSDDDLIAQFRSEAIERGYSDAAADGLALGRLRHLRAGGDGYNVLVDAAPASDAASSDETASDETESDDAGQGSEVEKPDTARLKAPAGSTSLSMHGAEYTVDETGHVEVPGVHVAHLLERGFSFGEE